MAKRKVKAVGQMGLDEMISLWRAGKKSEVAAEIAAMKPERAFYAGARFLPHFGIDAVHEVRDIIEEGEVGGA